MKCYPFRVLAITDGTTRVNLLQKKSGFCCIDWTPSVTEPKGGGVWRDSPMADGRTLAMKKQQNATETYTLQVHNWSPDDLIKDTQDLRRLLEKATAYRMSQWQSEPVWIEAQGVYEENLRYSLIEDYRTPTDGYPYGGSFWNALGRAAFADWPLILEREPHWRSVPPGQPCPESRSETLEACFPYHLEFNADTSDVTVAAAASINNLPDNAVSFKGPITLEACIRADGYGEGNTGRIFDKINLLLLVSSTEGLRGEVRCAGQVGIGASGLDEFTADGLWHHVLMTYSETGAGLPLARTVYLAIDGVWVASYTGTSQPSAGNYNGDAGNALHIGNNAVGTRCFDGAIGWVRWWDSILHSPAAGNFTPELCCDLPDVSSANVVLQVIYEGTGTTTYDRSGNDNDGTISNCEWDCNCDYTDTDAVECNCIQAAGEQIWEYEEWAISSVQPVAAVRAMIELLGVPGRMLAGETNEVWRNDDGGAVWAASAAPPAGNVVSIIEDFTDGDVFCATSTPAIYRSQNGGVNWALRTNLLSCVHEQQFIRASDGYFYIRSSVDGYLYRSNDDCAIWVLVFVPPPAIGIQALFETSTNRLLCFAWSANNEVGRVYFSDDGITWSFVQEYATPGGGISAAGLSVIERDGIIYLGTINGEVFASYDDGERWTHLSTISAGSQIYDFILHTDGYFYASAVGVIYKSPDMISWKTIINIGAASKLVSYSGNERIYLGENGNIWISPDFLNVGRLSCLDETFVANKSNIAQVTDVFVYDASTATYIDQFPAPVFPFFLLPSPAVAGDMLYIGLEPGVIDSGPFCSLIFDITRIYGTAAGTQLWEYSQGGGGWATLNVTDGTEMGGVRLSRAGVNGVFWVPPADWATDSPLGLVPAVTALWVRLHISVGTLANWLQSPMQGNRDIYTVTWPDVDIDDLQVQGDVPALLRIRAHNRSDEDGYTDCIDELDLLDNRLIIGLRSTDRGAQFTSFINLAEDGIVANTYSQNPIGITITDGTGTTTAAEIRAPSGIACIHTTTGNGLTSYDDVAVATFGPSISRDYYGTFHVFMRAQLEEPSESPSGDHDDVRVRLKLQTGSGGVYETIPIAPKTFTKFVGFDANGEHYKDFQLLDFGRATLPVSGSFDQDELPNEFTITVQIASAAGTNLLVTLYDINLTPVDEWANDFVDTAFENDSGVTNGYLLDADSVTYPKRSLRATVRTADDSAFIRSVYERVGLGPAILQANADQRLFFLSAVGALKGYEMVGGTAVTLTDTYADFVDAGVVPGMIAYNATTTNSAVITAVTATTCTTEAIAGNWNLNDVYFIVCPNWRADPYVVHSIQLEHVARYLSMRGSR